LAFATGRDALGEEEEGRPAPENLAIFWGPLRWPWGAGWGLKSWWYACPFEPRMRWTTVLSSRSHHCHFEPVTPLSFRAEGEKSWISIATGS